MWLLLNQIQVLWQTQGDQVSRRRTGAEVSPMEVVMEVEVDIYPMYRANDEADLMYQQVR